MLHQPIRAHSHSYIYKPFPMHILSLTVTTQKIKYLNSYQLFQIPKAMNVNNGAQQYTECLSAADEDATVPVTPVCRYLYIDDVVHFFVEAPGANRYNVNVTVNTYTEPMELVIYAVVHREHRLDRRYFARIQMHGYDYTIENSNYDVSNGEIHFWSPYKLIAPQPQVPLPR